MLEPDCVEDTILGEEGSIAAVLPTVRTLNTRSRLVYCIVVQTKMP